MTNPFPNLPRPGDDDWSPCPHASSPGIGFDGECGSCRQEAAEAEAWAPEWLPELSPTATEGNES